MSSGMFSFREYFNQLPIVSEEIHQAIQKTLDDENIPAHHKLSHITKHIRAAIKNGEATGIENATPKKGSSRAVFFPSDKHRIMLDGKEAHIHTALKVAFPGHLDKYNKSGRLLGEHQNEVEGDHFTNQHYGIISHTHTDRDGVKHYKTNHDRGILAPMLHAHEEGHHIHFGKIEPIKGGDFRALTKTKEFPKGISHEEFHEALNYHHTLAHGRPFYSKFGTDHLEKLHDHPLVEKAQDFVGMTGNHPGDLVKGNMGIWHHPHTGERHIVISDYGFNGDVAKHYQQARQNQHKALRGW